MDWLGLIAGGIAFNVEWKIDVDGASIWIAVNINSDDDKDGVSEIQFSYPSVNGFICPGAGEEKEVDLGPSLLAFFRSLTTASFHIHITDCVHSTTLRSTHFIKLTQCCSCHPNSETRTLLSVLKYVNLALIQFVCDGWLDSFTRFKHRRWKMRAPWSLSISSSFWGSVCSLQVPPPSPSVSQDSLRFSGVSTGLLGVFSAVVLISERIDKMLSGNYLHLFFGSNLRAATTRILGDSRVDSIRILHLYWGFLDSDRPSELGINCTILSDSCLDSRWDSFFGILLEFLC